MDGRWWWPLGREALYGQEYLKESIAFLDARSHARGDGGHWSAYVNSMIGGFWYTFQKRRARFWHMILIPYLQPTSEFRWVKIKALALLISYDEHCHIRGTFPRRRRCRLQAVLWMATAHADKEIAAPKHETSLPKFHLLLVGFLPSHGWLIVMSSGGFAAWQRLARLLNLFHLAGDKHSDGHHLRPE